MDINFAEYVNVITVLACLVVGYVLKHWVKDVDNKYIPTVVCILGVVLQCYTHGVDVINFVIGAISGLASTGFHQLLKQWIDEGK